jgi:glycine/D-amino acid oxidase-like deaminating enzyme
MKVCVVGGGIIGLSSALYMKKYGTSDFDVTIVTEKITPETTADGAAGIWGIYLLKDTPIQQQRQANISPLQPRSTS